MQTSHAASGRRRMPPVGRPGSRRFTLALLWALLAGAGLPPADLRAGASPSAFDVDASTAGSAMPEPDPVPIPLDGAASYAESLPGVPEAAEYDRLIRAPRETGPLDTDLFGESVDYFTGQTDFVATDVNLPGNDALPVALGRRYHVTNHAGGVLRGLFGDWDIDLPHVEGVFAAGVGWTVPAAQADARCTYFGAPPPAQVTTTVSGTSVTTSVPAAEYSLGFAAVIPGHGRHELLLRAANAPAPGGAHPVTTRDLWAVRCAQRAGASNAGVPDEGFVVTTPDGVTYSFLQASSRPFPPLVRPADTATAGVMATVDRVQYWLMPTRVQDRFGNSVVYTYGADTVTGQVELQRIDSSDGRHLTLTYSGGMVHAVSDGQRTWTYGYSSGRLTRVQLPDGTAWSIDFANLDAAHWTYADPSCRNLPPPSPNGPVSGTLQHPAGARGTFTFGIVRHGRAGAPATCLHNSANQNFAPTEPAVYDLLSLTQKQITGTGLPGTLTWRLAYSGCSGNACSDTSTTTLTDARNFTTVHTFGAQYGTNGSGNEGMLLRKQSGGSGGVYPRDEQYTYYSASGQPYPGVIGTPAQVRGDVSELGSLRPVSKRVLIVDGATYTRTLSNPDAYGFSRTVTRTGTDTRTDTLTYAHNTADWVLGTVQSVASGGATEFSLTLDGHSQPTRIRRFDRIDEDIAYNADGTIRSIADGNGHTTWFDAYSHGIPQRIRHPDSQESVTLSPIGQILSRTDTMGHRTAYTYDALGRLRTVTPPGGYRQTVIAWNTNGSGWTRSTTTGSATSTDYYDAFLRPVRTVDSAGHDVRRTFDADGRATFVSYSGAIGEGITSAYDGLGRLRTESDALGYAVHTTYGANTRTVLDRDGHQTTYTYLGYDEPSTAWPTSIDGREFTTRIQRDLWGKPKVVSRIGAGGALLRRFEYDANQLLSASIEPETGRTAFTHDRAGNITAVTRDGAATETRSYDARNRLAGLSYSDGSTGARLTWRADGQLDSATHGDVTRRFAYDAANLLAGETVTIDGTAYSIGYAYDGNQHLASLTYPDGATVAYDPDTAGRATRAGSYATGVGYFPNDAIRAFHYGNGIAHALVQDGRRLPRTVTDRGILDATYGYDGNGNPTSISDSANGAHSRVLGYDSADRLVTASGPWGSATFTYDALDNLTRESGGQGAALTFDASDRPSAVAIAGKTKPLAWDGRGRLLQKGSGASAMRFTFDAADRLTGIREGGDTWSYSYDALGLRARITGPAQNITSIYDHAGRLLYETETASADPDVIFRNGFEPASSPATATKYVYLGAHLVAKVQTAPGVSRTLYVHTDALGTPIAQTDAAGTIVGSSTYLAYGGLFASTGNGDETGPAYANHYADDTGLIYMQARYYDPQLRRFISPDPEPVDAATGTNFNRYAYANNSPFKYVDPDGRAGQLYWIARDEVIFTIPYIIGLADRAHMTISEEEINNAISQNFSGTVEFNGATVAVVARGVRGAGPDPNGKTNFILVVPSTEGITSSGRAETNGIGGNRITVGTGGAQPADANTIAHELGHAGGAGDQYIGGIDVNNNEVQQDGAGIMQSLKGGPANQQTLREILAAPTNTNTCAPGVTSETGEC